MSGEERTAAVAAPATAVRVVSWPARRSRFDADAENRVLRFPRGEVEMVANFSDPEHDGVGPRSGVVMR